MTGNRPEVGRKSKGEGSFETQKVNFRRQRWEITKGGFERLQDLEIDFDEGRCLGKKVFISDYHPPSQHLQQVYSN